MLLNDLAYQWQKEKQITRSGALVLQTDLRVPSLYTCCHCLVYVGPTKVCLPQAPVSPLKSLRFTNWWFTVELAGLATDRDPKRSVGKTTASDAGRNAVHLHRSRGQLLMTTTATAP